MILKLQNGDKFKIESDEKREAKRKFKEYSQLSIGQKLKRNLNIASHFLKSGPNITNFGNAVSALFGGYSPENPDLHYGEAPGVGIKNFGNLVKTARVAREFSNVLSKAPKTKEFVMPGLIGWAPKTKFKGYHASNENPFIPDFFREGWAQKTHNAIKGIYIANGKTPGYGFLTKRKYVHPVETTFEKPQIQLGEVKGRSKNSIRNQIERDAQEQGADGIIFKGIVDNQMQNQFIAKTLNPNVKITNRPVNISQKPNARQFGMQKPPDPFEELQNPWNRIRTQTKQEVNPVSMDDEYLMQSAEGRSLLYNAFIHGKDIPIIGKQNITNGLSDVAKTHLLENTVGRNIREFKKEGQHIGDYYSKIQKALENVKVGRYPKSYYTEARSPFEGFYTPDENFISLPEYNVFGEMHEGRHLIDHISSLTPRQEDILSKAFSNDFINLPKWKLAPETLKKYKPMDRERVTTNRDARHILLSELNVPQYSFNFDWFKKRYNINDDMLTFQNNAILTADADEIIEAIESSNGYGKTYINYLRSNNKLTPEKINQFKQSMIHVGNYIPPIIGGTLLNQLFNIKEEKK